MLGHRLLGDQADPRLVEGLADVAIKCAGRAAASLPLLRADVAAASPPCAQDGVLGRVAHCGCGAGRRSLLLWARGVRALGAGGR